MGASPLGHDRSERTSSVPESPASAYVLGKSESFNGEVKPDLIPVLKTVGDGLLGRVDPHGHFADHDNVNTSGERWFGIPEDAQGGRRLFSGFEHGWAAPWSYVAGIAECVQRPRMNAESECRARAQHAWSPYDRSKDFCTDFVPGASFCHRPGLSGIRISNPMSSVHSALQASGSD